MTALFLGSALCEVDQNGAVPIPGFLADALGGDSSDLLLSRHGSDTCLVGYARDHLATLATRTEARRVADEARGEDASGHYRRMRRTFGAVEKMARANDTMTIPAAMRQLGKIGALALFVGAGDSFEIWNPDLAIENEDEQFRDLAAFQLKARETHRTLGVP
jgi:DNA-binding transcriptional regulator/RsmH inhibitor MraZ